jgi:hypothetical protein
MKGIDSNPAMLSYGLEYRPLSIGPSTVMLGGHLKTKRKMKRKMKRIPTALIRELTSVKFIRLVSSTLNG